MPTVAEDFAMRINAMTYSSEELPIVVFAILSAFKKFYNITDADSSEENEKDTQKKTHHEKLDEEEGDGAGAVASESSPPSHYSYGWNHSASSNDGEHEDTLANETEGVAPPPAAEAGAEDAAGTTALAEEEEDSRSDSFFSATSMSSAYMAQIRQEAAPASPTGNEVSLEDALVLTLKDDPHAFFSAVYTSFAKLSLDRSRILYQYMSATPPEKMVQRQLHSLLHEMHGEDAKTMSREEIIAFNKEHIERVIAERQSYLKQKEDVLMNNIFFNYLNLYYRDYVIDYMVGATSPKDSLPEKEDAVVLMARAKGLLDRISESFISPVNTVVEYASARDYQYKEYMAKLKAIEGGAKAMYGLEHAAPGPTSPLATVEQCIDLLLEDEQAEEMKCSLEPYETALMRRLRPLTASREALGQLVLPFTCPPERVEYGGGYVRLTPFLKKEEVERVLVWLGANDGDKILDLTQESEAEAEKQRLCEALLPDDDCPAREMLTLVTKDTCMRTTLTNPLLSESVSGFQCDSCSRTKVNVGFQAVLYDNVRNTNCLFVDGCAGFDICIPCVVFFYKTSMELLVRALHPDPRRREPMFLRPSDTTHRQMVVWSAETKAVSETEWRVRLVVGCGLYVAQPVAWEVREAQLMALRAALAAGTTPAEEEMGYLTLTEELRDALPVVPPNWREHCRRLYRVADGAPSDGGNEDGTCAICLESLSGTQLTLRTRCGHWYHVGCLEDIRKGKVAHHSDSEAEAHEEDEEAEERGDVCPLCREHDYLPKANRPETLEHDNVHYLEVVLSVTPGAREAMVAVGVLLTRDGAYYNPTNLVACQLLTVSPGKLHQEEIQAATP